MDSNIKLKINIQRNRLNYILKILTWKSQRRFAIRWIYSLKKDFLLWKPSPWITYDSIEHLDLFLRGISKAKIFEYGSGGSTLFWIKYGAKVVSIEHDPSWYNKINKQIDQNIELDYRLIKPEYQGEEWSINSDPAKPEDYATSDEKLRNYSFENYVKQVDNFPEEYFDLVVIDGRSRPACIRHCASKVRSEGLLLLDNSDRSYYLQNVSEDINEYERKSFYGIGPCQTFPWNTDIFIRN